MAHTRLIDEKYAEQVALSVSNKAPLTGPPKFGGLPSRRLGGCTIVQVENELKGKLIPGSSGEAGEGTNKSKMESHRPSAKPTT